MSDTERRRRGQRVARGQVRREAVHAAPGSLAKTDEPGTGNRHAAVRWFCRPLYLAACGMMFQFVMGRTHDN